MNQGAAGPAVAIGERMDGFKLRVGYGRLSYRRDRVVVAEAAQII
jgi:hypothetical protein